MAKKKMPPQLVEYFKKKNKGKNSPDSKEDDGNKAKESAEKGLKAAKAAKLQKDKAKK